MFQDLKNTYHRFLLLLPCHSPHINITLSRDWAQGVLIVLMFFNKRGKGECDSADAQMGPTGLSCNFATSQRTRGPIQEDLASSSPQGCWSAGQRFPEDSGQFISLSSFPLTTFPQKPFPDSIAVSTAVSIVLSRWVDTLGRFGPDPPLARGLISVRPLGPDSEQASSDFKVLPHGHCQAEIQAGGWHQPLGTVCSCNLVCTV